MAVKKPKKPKSAVQVQSRRTVRDHNREQQMDKALRMREAYEMRKAGASYALIAERLGYSSAGNAYRAVQNLVRNVQRETADELYALGDERLHAMLLVAYNKALKGDLAAMDRVLRIQGILDERNGVTGDQGTTTNIGQAVIVVGGTEEEFIKGLQKASSQQTLHNAAQGIAGELPAPPEEWDAWDEHDAGQGTAVGVDPDDVVLEAEIVD